MKLTIKEYAEQRGVSYESVRKQVVKYNDELEDHIIIENGVKILTDKAQEILNNHSKKQVIVYEADETSAIRELKEELEKERKEKREILAENSDLKMQLGDKAEQLSLKIDEMAEMKQAFADQKLQLADTLLEVNNSKYLIEKSKDELKQKDEYTDLIATNRQARRKYKKDKKRAEKEQKKQAKLNQEDNTQ